MTAPSESRGLFRALQGVKIRTLGMAVTLVLSLVVLADTYVFLRSADGVRNIGTTWREYDSGAAAKGDLLSNLRGALGYGGLIHEFRSFVLRPERMDIVAIHRRLNEVAVALAAYRSLSVNVAEQVALTDLQDLVVQYTEAVATVERMASQGAMPREIDSAVRLDDGPTLEALAVLHDELRKARHESAQRVYASVELVHGSSSLAALLTALVSGVVILSLIWFTRARVIEPLMQLGRSMENLAKGDAKSAIPALERRDEIGVMARSLSVFRDNLVERRRVQDALREAHDTLERKVRERTAELEEAIAKLTSENVRRTRVEEALIASERALQERVEELETARSALEDQGEKLTRLAEDLAVARDEAEAANRTKSAFLASMSHELRTPLNAVIGFSEIIKEERFGSTGSPQYLDYAGDIYSSGKHLLALINDILDLSKVESGKAELREDFVEFPGVVEAAVTMVRARAEKAGVAIALRLDEGLPLLKADERKLKQILANLLSNAAKFSGPGDTIVLRAWCRDESGFVFQVIDQGIGIAPEDIPTALSPFGQVDTRLSREAEGTGLGLPLSKSLTELHGGTLDLQSRPGAGTTVTVRLPAFRILRLGQAGSAGGEGQAAG